jgi:transmembrane sensor
MKPEDDTTLSPDDDPIEATAAAWLAEREEGLAPAQAREFERWCRQDPRHAAAVARLEHACAVLQKLPFIKDRLRVDAAQRFPEQTLANASGWRTAFNALHPLRGFRLAALGIAAAVALGAVALWQWPAAVAETRYATASQGYESVLLEDGSVLELNSNSDARVRFSRQERTVTLASGEAHFKVAPDPRRPFIVRAGDVAVRAVGTAFNVRLGPDELEVLVTQGRVSVSPAAVDLPARPPRANPDPSRSAGLTAPPAQVRVGGGATFLIANERAIVPFRTAEVAPRVEKVEPAAILQALAWQERKLQFSETPLREVAEQFNRRNRLQLVIADPELAGRPVGGTFAADNVEAFVRLLEKSGNVVAERRSEWQIVLRQAR